MYDESVDDPSRATEQAISDLQYAHEHYIEPSSSAPGNAYLTYDGRPMIFIFPKSGDTELEAGEAGSERMGAPANPYLRR